MNLNLYISFDFIFFEKVMIVLHATMSRNIQNKWWLLLAHPTKAIYSLASDSNFLLDLFFWGQSWARLDKKLLPDGLATTINSSMTSLLPHTVAQPIKWRFLPKNLSQLVIFVIELAFTWSWVNKNHQNLIFKADFLCQKSVLLLWYFFLLKLLD